MNKISLLFLIFFVPTSQKVSCQSIADAIKNKTVIVVIPNEQEKAYSNMMDAIQYLWKISDYKFMSTADAEKLYSDNDKVFMHLVTEGGNAENGGYLKLNLSK